MYWDRDYVYIKGRAIPHTTAAREWVCRCGGGLLTIWSEEAPHWRTVCAKDREHSPDQFIHKSVAERLRHEELVEHYAAAQVLEGLPEELRAAILANREEV